MDSPHIIHVLYIFSICICDVLMTLFYNAIIEMFDLVFLV